MTIQELTKAELRDATNRIARWLVANAKKRSVADRLEINHAALSRFVDERKGRPEEYAKRALLDFDRQSSRRGWAPPEYTGSADHRLGADDELDAKRSKPSKGPSSAQQRAGALLQPEAIEGLRIRAQLVIDCARIVATSARRDEQTPDWLQVWVEDAYNALTGHERTQPMLDFLRALDHASRLAHDHFGRRYDPVRAREARRFFRRVYPELDAKLTDEVVTAAITGWRAAWKHGNARRQWVRVREAVRRFWPSVPATKQLAEAWEGCPHLLRLDNPSRP